LLSCMCGREAAVVFLHACMEAAVVFLHARCMLTQL
jgi:hypothetical protein